MLSTRRYPVHGDGICYRENPARTDRERRLAGNSAVPNVDRQRLFRRQAPVLVEPVLQIGRGKTPDLLQKAVLQEALPVSPGQVARTNGGRACICLALRQVSGSEIYLQPSIPHPCFLG
jgi:hypothetical protein